jgi:hypothetical protein
MPDERIRFWSEPKRWPRDTSEWVFLARAIIEVGECLHGEKWTGEEPTTPVDPALSPYRSSAAQWHQTLMHDLLRKHRPEFKRKPIGHGYFGWEVPPFTDDEWGAALVIASRIAEERRPKLTRFANTQWSLRDALAEGLLISALRPTSGGAFSAPLPPAVWNTERLSHRFFFCQMNPRDPFGAGVAGDSYQYVFVSRPTLDRYLAALRNSSVKLRSTIAAERECQLWLESLMTESPGTRSATKGDLFQVSQERFGVTGRAFERAWGKAITSTGAAAWKRAGPLKKS